MVLNKNQNKIWIAILVISILLVPIVANQYSLYKIKTRNNYDIIQKCVDEGFLTRERCEEIPLEITEEFLENYKQVSFNHKYLQGFEASFNSWAFWLIPIILFLIYLKINSKGLTFKKS